MSDFFRDLTDPNLVFLRYALIAGLLGSVAFGMIGTYVVARRISYIAGAISHSVLAGVGAALFFTTSQQAAAPNEPAVMLGTVAAALLSALIIGLVSLYAKEREDTVIGAVWVIGMAIGLIFFAKTPGYVEPESYLFGNILMITRGDLWLIAALDLIVIFFGVLFSCPNL